MKSPEMFWAVVGAYNEATLGMQGVLLLVGLVLTGAVLVRPAPLTQALLRAYFALTFAWLGVVFFLLRDPSPMGRYFAGPLFLICAVLFAGDIRAGRNRFALPSTGRRRTVTGLLLALVLLYPVISFLLGHRYPRMTTPLMPCPVTVWALALLTGVFPSVNKTLYGMLLVWAALGLPKCFGLFDVREDCILFAAGVYGAVVWVWDSRGVRYETT